MEILQRVIKREKEEFEGKLREDPYQPGTQPSWNPYQPGKQPNWEARRIMRAHPLPDPTREKLAASGMAIIVSLGFLEDQAETVKATHFHIHPTEPEVQIILSWTKVELLAGFHPSIVMSFDNISVKDRALAQLQHTSRFNFLEDKGLQLEAHTLREGIARDPIFMLGSRPLESLALLDESLRTFFWYKGYIWDRDLITERVRGLTTRKVLIRNNLGFNWVQKCTVTKGGNADQEIPAEPAETCSICPRPQVHQPVVRESVVLDNWGIPRQIPKFPDHLRSAYASKLPVRRDAVPSTGNTARPAPMSQDKACRVAPTAPETQRQVKAADTRRSVPTSLAFNDGSGFKAYQNTYHRAPARDAFQTPAHTSTAPIGVRAPSRKVVS